MTPTAADSGQFIYIISLAYNAYLKNSINSKIDSVSIL